METESLSDKIIYALDGRMHCKECKGHALHELLNLHKDFIQKLKKKLGFVPDHWITELIDKLAGDALIHSPEAIANIKKDTPEEHVARGSRRVHSSGTHGIIKGKDMPVVARGRATDNQNRTNSK